MSFVFLFDARTDREYALRINDRDGKLNTRLFAFEPGKQEAQPLPPNTAFYAVEEKAFIGRNEKQEFLMRARVWSLETNGRGKLAGVAADTTVDYGIYIVEEEGRHDISFQLDPTNLPELSKAIVSRPGFPANFRRALDREKFDIERMKNGTMTLEEIASLTFPPHHGPRAENARLNLAFALLNQPEEPKIMPLRLATEFKEAKTPHAPRRKRARKPPTP